MVVTGAQLSLFTGAVVVIQVSTSHHAFKTDARVHMVPSAKDPGHAFYSDHALNVINSIDLSTPDIVSTIAGSPGKQGRVDGDGTQAEFSTGISGIVCLQASATKLLVADGGNGLLRQTADMLCLEAPDAEEQSGDLISFDAPANETQTADKSSLEAPGAGMTPSEVTGAGAHQANESSVEGGPTDKTSSDLI
eukprot:gene6493-3130_t